MRTFTASIVSAGTKWSLPLSGTGFKNKQSYFFSLLFSFMIYTDKTSTFYVRVLPQQMTTYRHQRQNCTYIIPEGMQWTGGLAPFLLNLGPIRVWAVSSTLRPLYSWDKSPVSINEVPGWCSGPVWTVWRRKIVFPLWGFETWFVDHAIHNLALLWMWFPGKLWNMQ
jgi:hypothetical protein